MTKAARLICKLAQGMECDLLDVGCGPATLMRLLTRNIHYYGIDIAIHDPAPNLVQLDFVENPIQFDGKKFDIVVAQGVFEYLGSCQEQKFSEIKGLLNASGIFLASYVNFDHRNKVIYQPYNNVQSFEEFHSSLSRFFRIHRYIPTSQRWHHREPAGRIMKAIHMPINVNIPLIGRMLAVEYFFVCSAKNS
jgi:SAM-dependent methyltransferase